MITRVRDSYKKHLPSMIFGPLLKVIEAVFDLFIPLIMKAVIDLSQYMEPQLIPNAISSKLASFIRAFNIPASPINDALVGGGIILVMGVLGYMITMVAQYMAAYSSVSVGTEVRNALYRKSLSLSKKQRDEIGQSKLLTLINSDSYQLQTGVLLFVRLIVRIPIILFGSLIFSFILDWRIGIAFSLIVPLIILVNVLILRKSSKEYISIQKELDGLSSLTSEVSEGSRVIRASNNQNNENARFENKTNDYQNKSLKVNKVNALINPLTFALTSIILIIIIYLLKGSLFSGQQKENTMIISTIIAEMAYLAQIFFVTIQVTQASIDIVKAGVSRRRIDSILTLNPAIDNIKNPQTNEVNDKEELIRFDHVDFSFNDDTNYFFSDLTFQIRKGETFGVIGGTGSGKSTIINLIERFYEVSKGEIYYNQIPLKEYDLSSLRNDLGLVNQKSSLFKGSIKSNLLMANPHATKDDIDAALNLAEAYDFVYQYEDNIDHEVKEGGINFSGGQRQRLCIARALIKNPKILILDDATSALDLLTDKKIREHISAIKSMTKIIISQRVATIKNADYILVLEGGKVVGLGKHEDLLKTCPIYLETYKSQIKKE